MMMIDGSLGEGGGQILRSSLTLSMVTGRPFMIQNIRAGRTKPGMMRQHLTAVKAAAAICHARIQYAEIGSRQLIFEPGRVIAGDYVFNIGSAGSTTLVLQTVLLPLALAGGSSRLVLKGGTHNHAAPSFEFIDRVFLPLVRQIGFRADAKLVRPGFYPAGGGEIVVEVKLHERLDPLHIAVRGTLVKQRIEAYVANLPYSIAKRETRHAATRLGWAEEAQLAHQIEGAPGTGNIVLVHVEHEGITELFVGFGRQGVSAESVADQVVEETRAYLAGVHPVGPHLADQLLLPMALGAGGSFVTGPLTDHTRTNITTLQSFLGVPVRLRSAAEGFLVDVQTAK